MAAIRLVLDRLDPPTGHRPAQFALPCIKQSEDAADAYAAITAAIALGELTPFEGEAMSEIVERQVRAFQQRELETAVAKAVATPVAPRREH